MTALYMERYLNYGLTREELMSGKPIIGIAQSGSALVPCNRHHLELAKRVREGIRSAGGIALEFPTHPIQESSRRQTACLGRNLAYLGLVETLYAYPLDGVVLSTGCDKTTPAALMAAATVNISAICLNVGSMLNGYLKNDLAGSGMVVWKGREMYAASEMNREEFMDYVARGYLSVRIEVKNGNKHMLILYRAPYVGHCNTMGTASTMNALAEALSMALPGSAAIPAPYRVRAVDIMTRAAFENVIATNTAIRGSTNAPIHINAMAKHIGVKLSLDDWDHIGFQIPLLLNMQPAGEFLGRSTSAPADSLLSWQMEQNVRGKHTWNRQIIRAYAEPLMKEAGFLHLKGTLFNSAIMKTCVDYHSRLDDPMTPIDDRSILVMHGAGPMGAAKVVNMHPPARLLRQGITSLPCISDGRQSGTSGSPSILNARPEAAAGGDLALLRDGGRLRVDLNKRRVDILIGEEQLQGRREDIKVRGGFSVPESQTPWQEIFRETDQLNESMVLRDAVKYQRIAQRWEPRHNH
ncbi:hypothetical protein N7491_008675 [Penicillium cf. griseofulvum]|nr:hypothetical protein N7491_008675 [Penicillium cf. griseofulvum]